MGFLWEVDRAGYGVQGAVSLKLGKLKRDVLGRGNGYGNSVVCMRSDKGIFSGWIRGLWDPWWEFYRFLCEVEWISFGEV